MARKRKELPSPVSLTGATTKKKRREPGTGDTAPRTEDWVNCPQLSTDLGVSPVDADPFSPPVDPERFPPTDPLVPETRDEKGQWLSGVSGNPRGSHKKTAIQTVLNEALMRAQRAHNGLHLVQHFVNRAYEDDTVLVAVMRKVVPDLKQLESFINITGGVTLTHLSDDELRKRDEELTKLLCE